MWLYIQKTGELLTELGEVMRGLYAGNGEGKNNPEMQDKANKGPLPRGLYAIRPPFQHPKGLGPYCLRLVPSPGNDMQGRSGFLIHGDSIAEPGTASDGCIIAQRAVRERVWNSHDHLLLVLAEREDIPR